MKAKDHAAVVHEALQLQHLKKEQLTDNNVGRSTPKKTTKSKPAASDEAAPNN